MVEALNGVSKPLRGSKICVLGLAYKRDVDDARESPSFELMERFRLYPQTRNIPFFVMIKDAMKDGERNAMSRQIEHLVRKKELSREEFLAYLRRRALTRSEDGRTES